MSNVLDLASDLKAIASLTTQPHHLGRTLGIALHSLAQVIPFDLAVLYRLDGPELVPLTTDGPLASDYIRGHRLLLADFPTVVRVLDHGRPMALREEHHASDEGDPYDGVLDLPHGHSCMLVPLRNGESPIGLITLDRKVCVPYSAIEVSFADVYAQLISMALAFAQQAQLLDRYRHQLELQNHTLLDSAPGESPFGDRLQRTKSHAMQVFVQLAKQVAQTSLPVLIRGETGSGKELAARALHEWSERGRRPLVFVNCAAIPESLVESELFGHKRGAFSGALKDRAGRFVAANGGTLFLDEIGDMPMLAQAKLLRALQEGTFEPVGSDETVRVDVRVIAASHVDLEQAIRERRFREDLYYRLAAAPLALPALRERREDIVDLARERLRDLTTSSRGPWTLEPCALQYLEDASWPGNVRELFHAVERATAIVPAGAIRREHLSAASFETAKLANDAPPPSGPMLPFAEAERRHLQRALDVASGKIYGERGAAAILGLKPTTLQAKLKKHRLK